MSSKMRACKTCGQQIAKNAKRCPHCGAKNKKGNAFLFILVIVVLLIVVVSMKDDDDQRPADYPTRPTLSHEGNQTEGTKENITKPTVSPKPTQSNSNGIRAEIKESN